jgi:hypothetical protein
MSDHSTSTTHVARRSFGNLLKTQFGLGVRGVAQRAGSTRAETERRQDKDAIKAVKRGNL